MCIAVVAGIASFAQGALSSIASYSQEQAAYKAQMQAYRQSEQAYNQQLMLNQEAANRGYVSEQQKLQGEFMKASQEAQQKLVTSLQAQGTVLASGRTGQSIGLLLSDAERAYGRDFANISQNLAFAKQDYLTGAENIFQQQRTADLQAASSRMIRPSKPGAIGLVTGLAGAALGGFGTYASLQAPKGKLPTPKPTPSASGTNPYSVFKIPTVPFAG